MVTFFVHINALIMNIEMALGFGVVLINHCPWFQWSSSNVDNLKDLCMMCLCTVFLELVS